MPLKNSPKMKFRIKTEEAKPHGHTSWSHQRASNGELYHALLPKPLPHTPDHARTSLVSGVSPSLAPQSSPMQSCLQRP